VALAFAAILSAHDHVYQERRCSRESVAAENTFPCDLTQFEAMLSELQPLVGKVWRHCEGTLGRTATLKVKFAGFELISRNRSVAGAVVSRSELESVSTELLKALFPMKKGRQASRRIHLGFHRRRTLRPDRPGTLDAQLPGSISGDSVSLPR
jgi:DNA polymerase IV